MCTISFKTTKEITTVLWKYVSNLVTVFSFSFKIFVIVKAKKIMIQQWNKHGKSLRKELRKSEWKRKVSVVNLLSNALRRILDSVTYGHE